MLIGLFEAGKGIPCLFRLVTGLYCPGCGGTRAVRALLAGRLADSLRLHPLVPYMAAVTALWLGSRWLARITKCPRLCLRHEGALIITALAITAVNWAVKNYMLAVKGVDLLAPL